MFSVAERRVPAADVDAVITERRGGTMRRKAEPTERHPLPPSRRGGNGGPRELSITTLFRASQRAQSAPHVHTSSQDWRVDSARRGFCDPRVSAAVSGLAGTKRPLSG